MSYLITGGTKEERKQKAEEAVKSKHQVSSFDTLFISGETSIGIEQIRTLSHQLSLKPYNSPAKAAIVHPAELLTIEAQNALLKTLEEEEKTIIILTAPGEDFLLPTVVSRCQIIRLPQKSEIIIDQEKFNSILHFLLSIFQSGVGDRLKIASEIATSREAVIAFVEQQIMVLRKLMFKKYTSHDSSLPADASRQAMQAGEVKSPVKIIRQVLKTREYLEANVNPRLALEVLFLDLQSST